MKFFLFNIKLKFKFFLINHFWRLYKLSWDIKCKRGNHFIAGVWNTNKTFCLHCNKDFIREEVKPDGYISY